MLFAVLSWIMIAGLVAASAQNYSLTDLGYPGNTAGAAAEAHGVNNSGMVVGTWWPPAHGSQGNQYAFLYSNATNRDLGTIKATGYDYATANAVNNSNLLVGQGTANGSYVYHAFLWTNGVMTDLDNTGQGWSSANAINQQGQIVGEFTTPLGLIHAFLYTNNTMQDLGTLPGGTYSTAKGINNRGVIVGESADASGNVYAFIYSNGVMSSLGTLPGGNYSAAFAINDAGLIAGEANGSNGETHAFLYKNSTMTDLGTLGGTNSTASGINSGGEVTGYALTADESAHAFVFNGSNMVDLHTSFMPPVTWTNVFLTLAYAINDAGQVAGSVNYITNGTTNYDAILLTPPVLSLSCSNITVTAPTILGAFVSFNNFSATGGCSPATVTASPPSGSLFPIGTTTVNVTASDLCGHTNIANFTVTVNPPALVPILLTCPTNMIVTAASTNGAVVSFLAVAVGGCGLLNVTAIPPSGSVFPIGTTIVTNTASDLCGDSTNGTFTVTVKPPPLPLTLSSPALFKNGKFLLTLQGLTGQSFVIQGSTDLINWVPLYTNILPGPWTNWQDPASATNSIRFYRTITLPQ